MPRRRKLFKRFIRLFKGVIRPFKGSYKALERGPLGITSLGFPGLSSQSISKFFGFFRLENPQIDWDDEPGLPRLVIPVRFRLF